MGEKTEKRPSGIIRRVPEKRRVTGGREEGIMRIHLLALLALAAVAAISCVEENDPSPCEEYGHLLTVCLGCSGIDDEHCDASNADACEGALSGDELHDGMQCLLDCDPSTCDELDACADDCDD
jgi:hypothetical protein